MILVTGATGTIGTALVQALQAKKARFKLAVRSAKKAQGAETVAFDWDDFKTYLPAMKGVEKLFLLTPISDRSVGYTTQAVAAAKRAGVKHIVKLSVTGADGQPGIILGRQHFAAEKEIQASGIAWTMLRPTFFMQNYITYYGADPTKDADVYLPRGQGKATLIDARDIGEVAAAVLTSEGHAGKIYDLTGSEALTTQEALDQLGRALGHKYRHVDVPEDAARKSMEEMGMPLWMVDGFNELNWIIKQGWTGEATDGVKKVLGREPRKFAEYARDAAAGKA
jgi:uncharacterized protein YbjT (DUF2867 family)